MDEKELQKEDQLLVDDFLESAKAAGIEIEMPSVEDPNENGIGASSGDYVPRLTKPTKTNKYYMTTKYGGLNECIAGSPAYTTGSALSNCVGYAWGRSYENLGSKPKLSKGNAENWYGHTADGYKRGQTPKLGAVACWRKGQAGVAADGAGHVAVVEKIEGKKVTLSNSAWGGNTFYLTTYNEGAFSHGAYIFQGFIYVGDWTEKEGLNFMFELKPVEKGSKGNDVKLCQKLLKADGYKGKDRKVLTVDGISGNNTVYAIKAFQKAKKLTVDGICGKATWKALLGI